MNLEGKVVNVTPAVAENWLAHNTNNRNVSRVRVNAYAEQMKRGEWKLNGEAVVFGKNGELKDGQHRLMAVVQSGITVPMFTVFGVDDDICIYDRGRGRSTLDVLKIAGLDRRIALTSIVSVAKLHYYMTLHRSLVSDKEIEEFIERNKEMLLDVNEICKKATTKSGNVNTSCATFMLATLYALASGVATSDLMEFFQIVRTGVCDSGNKSSALVFRNDVVFGKIPISGASRREGVWMTEKAIRDFATHTRRTKTYSLAATPVYSKGELAL